MSDYSHWTIQWDGTSPKYKSDRLLQKNPLEDIANTRKLTGVMAAGRWYDNKALEAFLTP